MKSAFAFTNWNMALGFTISWGVWKLLAATAIPWGWITVDDGFIITLIFTITSYVRVYLLNLVQLRLLNRRKYHD